LPVIFHDYTEYDNLISDLEKLENQNQDFGNVEAKIYNDNLVVIYCGNYVKFGVLAKR
jgi:hypothetical protein